MISYEGPGMFIVTEFGKAVIGSIIESVKDKSTEIIKDKLDSKWPSKKTQYEGKSS